MYSLILKRNMKKFKFFLISFCVFSLSNTAKAEFDGDSYYYGYLTGYLASTCYNYKEGFLSEEKAKNSVKASIYSIDELIQNDDYKTRLLAFGDDSLTSECKKLMP